MNRHRSKKSEAVCSLGMSDVKSGCKALHIQTFWCSRSTADHPSKNAVVVSGVSLEKRDCRSATSPLLRMSLTRLVTGNYKSSNVMKNWVGRVVAVGIWSAPTSGIIRKEARTEDGLGDGATRQYVKVWRKVCALILSPWSSRFVRIALMSAGSIVPYAIIPRI